MEAISCRDVVAWLHQNIHAAQRSQPPAAVIEHIAGCDRCRGALLLLFTEALQPGQPIAALTCDQCENRLATFVELEGATDMITAARQLPDVWLHLCTCADCWEVYTMLQRVVAVERQGLLPRATLHTPPAPAPSQWPLTFISRAVLQVVFPSPSASFMAAGITRGDTPVDMVLDAQEETDPQFVISVRRNKDLRWELRASVTPHPVGWLLLALGENRFRARFDGQGVAVVPDIPEMLLTAVDGPDLTVSVEVDVTA